MKAWWSVSELATLAHPALPSTARRIRTFAEDRGWDRDRNRCRDVAASGGRSGLRREYHVSLLPMSLQVQLQHRQLLAEEQARAAEEDQDDLTNSLWERYERAPGTTKAKASRHQEAAMLYDDLAKTMSIADASHAVTLKTGLSRRTIDRIRDAIAGHHRSNWLPALTPAYGKGRPKVKMHPEAFDFIVSDFRRPEESSFKACYDRLLDEAEKNGWGRVPSPKTLLRHVRDALGPAALVMGREGVDAAMRLIPSLERDKTMLHAMEAVNADGHVGDTMVLFPDGTVQRPIIVGFQDIYSSAALSHRVGQTENKELIRLAAADMVTTFGVPEHAYFDNGRAFMAKMLTGRMKVRFRGKFTDKDPRGIFPALGTQVHAVLPYHGQSKPIERLWRNICDRVAKHPECAGAYTGNSPVSKPENYGERAVPLAVYEKVLAKEIDRYNKEAGRNTRTARGRSYAETFRESYESDGVVIAKASAHQRRLFLLEAQQKASRKANGEIHLGENRYWCEELIAHAGRQLTVRFDPDNLHDDLFVYSADDSVFIARAPCIEAVGYRESEGARQIAKLRNTFRRKWREALLAHGSLSAAEIAAQMASVDDLAEQPMEMPMAKVVGLDFAGSHELNETRQDARSNSYDADAFGRGLNATLGISSIFDHPNKKEDG